ncbi:uncharacterized protein L3040_003622 [Drepanopeziza brunnea f. sp. 'multigermtubi']|uniref:uncharacterized protein n=1 Tax=Drepanopeziza brunnea f. sp. 'multigermtubi' TaxID=698441 RepID=UPI0023A07B66|nr:hypothetical protein L3040_003622 [Drepanopeziza brunnea f. sp. 'multigermtubi']
MVSGRGIPHRTEEAEKLTRLRKKWDQCIPILKKSKPPQANAPQENAPQAQYEDLVHTPDASQEARICSTSVHFSSTTQIGKKWGGDAGGTGSIPLTLPEKHEYVVTSAGSAFCDVGSLLFCTPDQTASSAAGSASPSGGSTEHPPIPSLLFYKPDQPGVGDWQRQMPNNPECALPPSGTGGTPRGTRWKRWDSNSPVRLLLFYMALIYIARPSQPRNPRCGGGEGHGSRVGQICPASALLSPLPAAHGSCTGLSPPKRSGHSFTAYGGEVRPRPLWCGGTVKGGIHILVSTSTFLTVLRSSFVTYCGGWGSQVRAARGPARCMFAAGEDPSGGAHAPRRVLLWMHIQYACMLPEKITPEYILFVDGFSVDRVGVDRFSVD